jgi:lipid-binding SYLF domain-containing protein
MMKRTIETSLAILLFFVFIGPGALPSTAQVAEKVADRFWEATKLLEEMTAAADGGIPQNLVERAECVGVIPGVVRAAFIFGGRYGRGLLICRTNQGEGPWGAPSMLSLGGGSFGFQIGGQSTDVLMLFMTFESVEELLADELTLGADASVAAGPVGRGISAETSATFGAEILTYARSKGVFAGLSFEGGVLRPDDEANLSLYGHRVTARSILLDESEGIPEVAGRFVSTLSSLSSRGGAPRAVAP